MLPKHPILTGATAYLLATTYKVLITLRYLATGVIQLNTGDLHFNEQQMEIDR
ncbi:hypothetical protein DPMN_105228 [Dreissena polymorpha]|uniref:Uncharacterized protein n=1 Tax=Dreissena polymorpha TaxID=45954 RepID=A0A9D4HBF8_DREPO|nr:hypothetical protein DPMN_105228 [Dreissena polymorpha]